MTFLRAEKLPSVFLTEGIQKFLFPDSLDVGQFVKIGVSEIPKSASQ